MSDTIKIFEYKDASENTLYELMIWWGSLYSGSCLAPADDTEFTCFDDSVPLLPYALTSPPLSRQPKGRTDEIPVYLVDLRDGEETLLEAGDKIVFDDELGVIAVLREDK